LSAGERVVWTGGNEGNEGLSSTSRMRYALVNDELVEPRKGERERCGLCEEEVIAKCGAIKVHHWAHLAGADCDPWSEPISEWHISWQDLVIRENVECIVGRHRADILTSDNSVVELQHSPISVDESHEREDFYGRMVWIFDATHRFNRLITGKWGVFSFGQDQTLAQLSQSGLSRFRAAADRGRGVLRHPRRILRLWSSPQARMVREAISSGYSVPECRLQPIAGTRSKGGEPLVTAKGSTHGERSTRRHDGN
jgi:hypothetical protein